jgi:hypothetical protein
MASVPEPGHAPDYSQAQQIAGAAMVIGAIALAVIGAIIRRWRDP